MQTVQLSVSGMTCGCCATAVTGALQSVDGVEDAVVTLATGTATIEFDQRLTSREDLALPIVQLGHDVNYEATAPSLADAGCLCH